MPNKHRHTGHRINLARGLVGNLVRRAQPTAFDAGPVDIGRAVGAGLISRR